MRVINGITNEQIGVIRTDDAISRAKALGLDLIEVAPHAQPPVCRILDFGKFRYDLSKQEKEKKNTAGKVKEVKFRVNISEHDYLTKVRHAEEFLDKGNKVKVHLQFRGREMAHPELGSKILDQVIVQLGPLAKVEAYARLEGRNMTMVLAPDKKIVKKEKDTKKPDSGPTDAPAPAVDTAVVEATQPATDADVASEVSEVTDAAEVAGVADAAVVDAGVEAPDVAAPATDEPVVEAPASE